MPSTAPTPPAWVRRFRAPRVSLPAWARQAPQRCSYATNASGVWQLVSWDIDTDVHIRLTDKPTGVGGGAPTPDGSGVVWFDDGDGDEVGRYVVTPFTGGDALPLAPSAGIGWSAGVSLQADIAAVGAADRDGFRILTGPPARPGSDAQDGLRPVYTSARPAAVGGLSRDGALLALSHCEHGDVLHPSLKILEARTGEVLAELHDGDGNMVSAAGWAPIPGDTRLALLADRSGSTRPELYDSDSGERRALSIDLPGEVWVADWWPDATALLLGHDHLGRTSLLRYDLGADRAQPLDLADGTIRSARVRPDCVIWYAFDSSAEPPRVRLRGRDGTDRALLDPPGERAPSGQPYTSLHYPNGDGDQVHAFLVTPPVERFGEGRHPLVVDIHGGPQAHTEDTFSAPVQAWVDHGYAVLMPNYRGSTGYGKRWGDQLEGDPGRPELVDILAGRDHLVASGVADPGRTVLTGGSWGGYLALQGIGTQPHAWCCAVAVVPVADYLSAFADESPELREFDVWMFGGTPEERPELWRDRSPITHVDRVRAPVLIITGRNDTRCPLRQVENYVEALRARGGTVELDVFEAGHGSYAVEEQIREQRLSLDWAARHLGTPPAQL